MSLFKQWVHHPSVSDELDSHFIRGYKKLPPNVRANFEQRTFLGKRLVELIELRNEFIVPSDWYKDVSRAIQACVELLFLYRAKSRFINSIPRLKRESMKEYNNIFAEVKSVGEDPQCNPNSIDSSRKMIFIFGRLVGPSIPMGYINAGTARQLFPPLASHASVSGIDNVVKAPCNV